MLFIKASRFCTDNWPWGKQRENSSDFEKAQIDHSVMIADNFTHLTKFERYLKFKANEPIYPKN